jgi:hypothetical protein
LKNRVAKSAPVFDSGTSSSINVQSRLSVYYKGNDKT